MKNPIFVLLLLICCTSKDQQCEVDSRFTAKFYNCIAVVAVRQGGVYTGKDTWNAYECLSSITGVKSNVGVPLAYANSDTINYFCLDLQAWLQWYEANKCGYTLERAASVLQRDSTSWPRDLNAFHIDDLGCIIHPIK